MGTTGILEVKNANPLLGGGSGQPPAYLTGCHVFLGSRLLDHWLAGPLLQFRHVYINIYEDASNYALIEAGPNDENRTTNGTTHAEVYYGKWEVRGVQWEITPKINCSDFIACIKRKVVEYNDAAHPYNFDMGPNSNSFAWWVLNECGLDISFLISPWPYLGIDYWKRRPELVQV
jgi:hypothetical protein